MTGRIAWGVMAVFAVIIAGYAAAVLLLPGFGAPFVQDLRAAAPFALYAHLGGGALAMALGPWQFSTRIRQRALTVHRWTGRGYVIAVLVGGLGGVLLAPGSMHGLVTHVGFGLLGVLWLGTTLRAWLAIRGRDNGPPTWMTELRAHPGGRHASHLAAPERGRGHSVSRCLPGGFLAVLGPQPHRRRVAHPSPVRAGARRVSCCSIVTRFGR
jgi:hypothetical protein